MKRTSGVPCGGIQVGVFPVEQSKTKNQTNWIKRCFITPQIFRLNYLQQDKSNNLQIYLFAFLQNPTAQMPTQDDNAAERNVQF